MAKGGFPSAKVLLSVQMTNAPCSRSIMLLMKQTLQDACLKGPISALKCFQYSERQWCGALRASEWDRETGIMTIWHQGKHICLMKKPPIEKGDAAKMITMLKQIMRLNPYATKTQIMDLGSHYHLSRGDHRLSQLFIRICMRNKSIYEQTLKEVSQETVGLDWSSINAVVKLKQGQDSVDPYHIYKVNDKKWNSRPNFCHEKQ